MSAVGIGLMVLPIAHFRAVFKLRYSNFRTLPNPEEYQHLDKKERSVYRQRVPTPTLKELMD